MKNLGSFNEESIALFKEHFEGSAGFAESTEEFLDFGRCQRPDGSFYGTSGQCRKGKESGDTPVAPAPPKGRMTKKDPVANVLKTQKETSDLIKKVGAEQMKKNPALRKEVEEMKARQAKLKAAQEGGSGKSPTRLQQQKEVLRNFRAIEKAKIAARDSSTSEGVRAANKSHAAARSKAWNSLAQMKPEIKGAIKDWESGRAVIDNPKSTPEQRWAQWPKVNKAEAQINKALQDFKDEVKAESAARKRN